MRLDLDSDSSASTASGSFSECWGRSKNKVVIQDELGDCVEQVDDLVDTVFGTIRSSLADQTSRICRVLQDKKSLCIDGEAGSCWPSWPKVADEIAVINFLESLCTRLQEAALRIHVNISPERQFFSSRARYLRHRHDEVSEARQGAVFGILQSDEPRQGNVEVTWDQLLVLGVSRQQDEEDDREAVKQGLYRYAREAYKAVYRRFVLGLSLCGTILRLWHIDRLGMIRSRAIDIEKEPVELCRVLLGLLLVNEQDLGLDPSIKDGKITIERDGQIETFVLDLQSRTYGSGAVIGRGSSGWVATKVGDPVARKYFIKDSWIFVDYYEEGEALMQARVNNLPNVVRHYHHAKVHVEGQIDDIQNNVRRGITFQARIVEANDVQNRDDQDPPPRRIRNPVSSSNTNSINATHRRLTTPAGIIERNRERRRVITEFIGQPISEISDPLSLVKAMRGAIKGMLTDGARRAAASVDIELITGHQALYERLNILHGDISYTNIAYDEARQEGFILDLDCAIVPDADEAQSRELAKTGTRVFMAIGVLRGEKRTFKHDLESFYWVYIWLIFHHEPSLSTECAQNMDQWSSLTDRHLISAKLELTVTDEVTYFLHFGEESRWQVLTSSLLEFCSFVRPLVRSTEISSDHRPLYRTVLQIMDNAVASIENDERQGASKRPANSASKSSSTDSWEDSRGKRQEIGSEPLQHD